MPTTIRLKRMGRKRQPTYRIVVVDSARAVTGPSIERLGLYNPRTEPSFLELDAARTLHWLREGAEPSHTVRSLLRRAGVWEKFHADVGPEELEEAEIVLGPAPDRRKTSQRPTPAAATTGRPRAGAAAGAVRRSEAAASAEEAAPAEEVSAPAEAEPPVETEAELADAGTSPAQAAPTGESGVAPPDAAGQEEPVPDTVESEPSTPEGAAEEAEVRATEALAADAATEEAGTEENGEQPAPSGTDESDAIREGSAVPSAEKTEPAAAPVPEEEEEVSGDEEASVDEEAEDEK